MIYKFKKNDYYLLYAWCNTILKLTRTESHVAILVLSGRINKDIAKLLSVREKTIKYHITNIFQKLGITRRQQLIFGLGIFDSFKKGITNKVPIAHLTSHTYSIDRVVRNEHIIEDAEKPLSLPDDIPKPQKKVGKEEVILPKGAV